MLSGGTERTDAAILTARFMGGTSMVVTIGRLLGIAWEHGSMGGVARRRPDY